MLKNSLSLIFVGKVILINHAKGVLENFPKFTGKGVSRVKSATKLKKGLWHSNLKICKATVKRKRKMHQLKTAFSIAACVFDFPQGTFTLQFSNNFFNHRKIRFYVNDFM